MPTLILVAGPNGSGKSTISTKLAAGVTAMSLMKMAKRAGYRALPIDVALGEPDLHIDRVRLRVAQGGHGIPDADIRRRYFRSLSRAPEAIRLADQAIVLDNAGPESVRADRFAIAVAFSASD